MIKIRIKAFTGLILLIIIQLCGSQISADQSDQTPVIHLENTTHMFPTSFEGEKLSHSFKLFNKGTADLEILDVTQT